MDDDELKSVRKEIRILIALSVSVITVNLVCFALFLLFWFLGRSGHNQGQVISNDASQVVSTNIQIADELEAVRKLGKTQGYYTREQFAKLIGKDTRTVDRYRQDGRLDSYKQGGMVYIPLDATLSD